MDVTIAICTYNRAKYLDYCLGGFIGQIENYQRINILIVDNNSEDQTHKVYKKYKDLHFPIRYVKEIKQGLSNARNCAIENCNSYYLGYLDDDAIPHKDYLERLFWIIDQNEQPDCFGGTYYPYYENEKPKWMSDDFGKKTILSKDYIKLDSKFLSGGNMYCKLSIMKEIGGFDPTRGMIGYKLGYAEEDDFQNKLRKLGYSIYYDPKFAMDHLVPLYKQKVKWHIKKTYTSSSNTLDEVTYKKYTFSFTFKSLMRILVYKIPRLLKRIYNDENYYSQNFILDVGTTAARSLGLYFNRNK